MISLSQVVSVCFRFEPSSSLNSIATLRYGSRVSLPKVFNAFMCCASTNHLTNVVLDHYPSSTEALLGFCERALDVVCAVSH